MSQLWNAEAEIARLRAECARLEDHINDADDENIRLRVDNERLQERLAQARTLILAAPLHMPTYPPESIARNRWVMDADKWTAALATDGKG